MRLEIPLSNQAVPYITIKGERVCKAARRLVISVYPTRSAVGSPLVNMRWSVGFSVTCALLDDRFCG